MKRTFLFSILVISLLQAKAQAPAGYYNSAEGLNGTALRGALHGIIKDHNSLSYNELWNAFKSTDKRTDNGKVWDIYSDRPGSTPPYLYTFGTDQCGSYSSENDCYNREHSWPQSHFNDAFPMRSDLYHLYPTDGWVNNKRGNYAYGEVSSPTWISLNGSRLGPNTFPGYSGTVFEPIDSFKGDLARTYFYMATRYYTEDGGWNNWAMANKAELKPWAIAMLLEWHHNDPVSQKEINRNNAVYVIQNNRNPFIDHPEYADCIWGVGDCSGAPTSIAATQKTRFAMYPNPARQQATLDLSGMAAAAQVTVAVKNLQGQVLIFQKENGGGLLPLDVSGWAKGIYLVEVTGNKGRMIKKLVVE